MALVVTVPRLEIQKDVGSLLMFRSAVTPFFRKIARFRSHQVVVDFSKVDFMSRSFADEYLAAKSTSKKLVTEEHVSPEVRRMFDLVSRQLLEKQSKLMRRRTPIRQTQVVSL